MLVEHTLCVMAKCPVNSGHDVYEVTLRLDRIVKVEDIVDQVRKYADAVMYQEDLTQALADHFRCEAESRGSHSGVKTWVRCTCASDGERDCRPSEDAAR